MTISRPFALSGLALPGLGHFLTGARLLGTTLIIQSLVWFSAGILGLPRLSTVLFPSVTGISIHGALSLIYWLALGVALWVLAWRRFQPAPSDPHTQQAIFIKQFSKSRSGGLGLCGALFLVSITLLTPMIAPFDPDAVDTAAKLMAPGTHPIQDGSSALLLMGTDQYGRDMFSRVLYGSRVSLLIGLIAVTISATIGVVIGALAGYTGGWIDRLLMWFVDLLLALPSLVLLLALVGLFELKGQAGLFAIVGILGATSWMSVSRIVRSQVLSLKQHDFVQAARALGFSSFRILFRHILPNALAPVIVYCSLAVGGIILAEAGLSFLGLGVSPPTSTWGTLVDNGREPLRNAPWIATFPGLFIVLAVMSFNLLGDGLRDALDPKLRGR